MAVVSFVGWWYQRRMRDVFGQCEYIEIWQSLWVWAFADGDIVVKKIDKVEFEREWPFRPRPAQGTMTNGVIDGQQN